jgi:nucleotide-binding universal stress UspA family protein
MVTSILVPLDRSQRAENILPHVEKLARCFDAKVTFLTVYRPPMMVGYDSAELALFQQNCQEQLAEIEKYLAGLADLFKAKGIATQYRVVMGPVVKEILDSAERENADLIAMCSHGRSGLSRLFYGSVASGVLNRVDRPLLIIRSGGENESS